MWKYGAGAGLLKRGADTFHNNLFVRGFKILKDF